MSDPVNASSTRPLRDLVVRGSSWTIIGAGGGHALRLVSNLLLTRLLFPEAFGLMALVWMVLFALEMLSDVGLGPAVIREPKGAEPQFLRTVWTLQVGRGVLLTLLTYLVALPISIVYAEPQLVELIRAASIIALINGFVSLSRYVEQRQLRLMRLTLLELLSQVAAVFVVIAWAYAEPSVWALLGGAISGRATYLVGSYLALPKVDHGLGWDAHALSRLLDFGKWIFPSSILALIAVQGDRMLLGYYLSLEVLGIYSIAILFTEAGTGLLSRLNFGVAFPAYGQVHRQDASRLRPTIIRFRKALDSLVVLPAATLIFLGDPLIRVLYDSRYHDAGWMLQLLAIKILMTAPLANAEAALVASGRPKYAFFLNAGRTAWILAGIPLGWSLAGLQGVVLAVALSEIPVLLTLWFGLVRHGYFSVVTELRTFLFALAGVLLGGLLLLGVDILFA